jgi:hypothetical protein
MDVRLALLLVSGVAWAVPSGPQGPPAPPSDATITLEAGCEVVYDRGLSAFTATLRNTGPVSASLTLGVASGGPGGYHPTNFSATVAGTGEPPDQFRYSAGLVGDGARQWLVSLPAGHVYRVRIPAGQMLSSRSARPIDMGYLDGSWRVRLVLHGAALVDGGAAALPLLRLATGTVEAAAIDVPEACTRVRAQ